MATLRYEPEIATLKLSPALYAHDYPPSGQNSAQFTRNQAMLNY
jgi:hypothetical protein